MTDFDVGSIVAGKYEIKQLLGSGGMGQVYRARQVGLGRDVALKVPSDSVLQSPEIMARFEREAKTVAKLTHDNIVQVYEYYHQDGLAFIAMEYVEGDDLKSFITRSPRDVTAGDMARILELACEGIAHAHENGIIHRDIKPHNIMVTRLPRGKWRVKVMDFGIAHIDPTGQFTEVDGGQLTQTGQALGTPSYMAPEQIRGMGVSHLSDIYSFGCVVYYAFTQQTVFTGSGLTVAVSHLNDAPPSLRKRIPGAPEEFEQLVLRCLEKDPAKRPQDASELGQQLLRAIEPMAHKPMYEVWRVGGLDGEETIPLVKTTSTPTPSSGAGSRLMEVQTQQTLAPTQTKEDISNAKTILDQPTIGDSIRPVEEPRKKSPVLLVVGGIGVVCLVAGIGVAVMMMRGGEEGQSADSTLIPKVLITPLPEATSADPDPTPIATPEPTQVVVVVPTPEPTPTPVSTPQVDRRIAELRLLRENFDSTNDFAARARTWSETMRFWGADESADFQALVLEHADAMASAIVRNPTMGPVIAAGLFTMGSETHERDERPVRNTRLRAYQIGAHEVTALEFAQFLNANRAEAGALYRPGTGLNVVLDEALDRYVPVRGRELHPANGVSWMAASAYAAWLSSVTDESYRLPTEAEWERAARGTTMTLFPWGNSPPDQRVANFNTTNTVEVTANPDGGTYRNLAGNVFEWVHDWYQEDYYAQPGTDDNPRGPDLSADERARRVLRGGSFRSRTQDELRASRRHRDVPARALDDYGFRLALTP